MENFELSCPIQKSNFDRVLLAHGSGGTLSHNLVKDIFLPYFGNNYLNVLHDGAILNNSNKKLAFTTDSYVVNPLFFPGGNIGDLAINGTVNDLAMCGALPKYISCGFIIEEGFLINNLIEIIKNMKIAADKAGVKIVTGDTKVVENGKGDGIFINTSGIGFIDEGINISANNCKPGDVILINGFIAEHGMAIMSVRNGFEFESPIISDTAALNGLVADMLNVSKNIHVLRDPTRGGIASTLNELAESSNVGILIDENTIPISDTVKAACEILGFDPLYVANEGKLIAFLAPEEAEKVLGVMKTHPLGIHSRIIGEVVCENQGMVIMKTEIGSSRIVDMLTGEQLPRIC